MDRDSKKLLVIFIFILIFGGIPALINFGTMVAQFLVALFPIFGKKIIEDYFTSPYFIVSVIMAIGSCFGIWIGKKGGKLLYTIIAIIVFILSFASISLNAF